MKWWRSRGRIAFATGAESRRCPSASAPPRSIRRQDLDPVVAKEDLIADRFPGREHDPGDTYDEETAPRSHQGSRLLGGKLPRQLIAAASRDRA